MDLFKDILNDNKNELYPLFSDIDQPFAHSIQKRNEINTSQDNNSIYDDQNSSDEESFILDQSKKRHRGGPKRDQVWNYINIGESLGDEHYKASCKYCGYEWMCGKLQILKRHLARECSMVLQDVKELWRYNLVIEEKSIKR